MKKKDQRELIDARLDSALVNVYHNATIHFPWEWYGKLSDKAWEAVWEYISFIGGFEMREYMPAEFGLKNIYQWGRGGRTVAPSEWVRRHGGSSFSMKESKDFELNLRDKVEFIKIVESFNAYVESWCSENNIREMLTPFLEEREEKIIAHNRAVAALYTI